MSVFYTHRTVWTHKSTHVLHNAQDFHGGLLTEGDLAPHISCRHCLTFESVFMHVIQQTRDLQYQYMCVCVYLRCSDQHGSVHSVFAQVLEHGQVFV